MSWKCYKEKWPNGREFWTVEDRQSRPQRMRIGPNGVSSKYYSHDMAKTERDRLNKEDAELSEGKA